MSELELSPVAGRVLGCLVEKERTVPAGYPLTSNSLLSAANQSTAREPIMAIGETDVLEAVEELRRADLVRVVHPRSGRGVVKYRHVIGDALDLRDDEVALWALLVLRGPQTVGELRGRIERLVPDTEYLDVGGLLERLGERDLATMLPRQPGQSADRWTTGLGRGEEVSAPAAAASPAPAIPATPQGGAQPAAIDEAVRDELVELRLEVQSLRADLDELRRELGLG